jgi:hypothetical protein
MYSAGDTAEAVGCPIRKSTDQSLLAAPHGLSQRAASFIASQCQGIHQMPFIRLFSALTRRVSRPTYECATRRRKPARDQHQPARIRQRCIVMTQPAASSCEATALSGHPRSLILFTCQRSHIRLSGYLLSLSSDTNHAGSLLVTVRHSSSWWRRTGSNRRPHACKARALPTELRPHGEGSGGTVVGQGRLELPTSRLSSARSNQLSY